MTRNRDDMTECELANTCIFFNDKMSNMPATSEVFKAKYCRGDKTVCARYSVYVAVGREKVPADLYPNERERADEIVNG